MPEIFASLSSGTIRQLGVEPAQVGGLRTWIVDGSYVPSINDETHDIELQNVTTREITPFLSFDFERFALASAESFLVAKSEWDSHSLMGWPLLKLYYAAFFAAHAIMRSQGTGVIKIEREQAKRLSDFLTILDGEVSTVAPGMYRHKFRTGTVGNAAMYLEKHGEGQGVHEAFWRAFCEFLNMRAEQAVELGRVDSNIFLAGASEITAAISGNAGGVGSWLSLTRNEINYQHKHSVWFPTQKGAKAIKALKSLRVTNSSSISLILDTKREPVEAFARTCHYLALLNFEIGDYLSARSTKGRAFGQKWRGLRATIE